jgi:multidrug resistance efflux pump
MRRLQKRVRTDAMRNDVRGRKSRWGRWVYLALVAGFFVWLGNSLFGDLLFLRAEGMITARAAVIATEFRATVREVAVEEGTIVEAGQVVGAVTSQEVVESLAELNSRYADLQLRLSDLRVRGRVAAAMLDVADQRAVVAHRVRERFRAIEEQGLITFENRMRAVVEEFDSLEEVSRFEAEHAAVEQELQQVEAALARTGHAIQRMVDLYGEGRLTAPAGGIVGDLQIEPGAVVNAGEQMLRIYHPPHFVLAFVPPGALYRLEPGDRVAVRFGVEMVPGTVSRVRPLAAALPDEFQRTFRPTDREQLIEIALDDPTPDVPLFTKVIVNVEVSAVGWVRRFIDRQIDGLWSAEAATDGR